MKKQFQVPSISYCTIQLIHNEGYTLLSLHMTHKFIWYINLYFWMTICLEMRDFKIWNFIIQKNYFHYILKRTPNLLIIILRRILTHEYFSFNTLSSSGWKKKKNFNEKLDIVEAADFTQYMCSLLEVKKLTNIAL